MSSSGNRLLSVDALRGFDMLVIIGLDALIHALARGWPVAPMQRISRQFTHAEWTGVHAYDLVFPLFIFLSGVSLAIVDRRPATQTMSRAQRLGRAARRMVILVILGIIYNFGWDWSWERLRFPSVLGLIGVSHFLASATLILIRDLRARAAVGIAVAAIVAGLQLFYPVPGYGAGLLTPEGSVNGYIDRMVLPGRIHGGSYDPEGLLGMLSAVTIALAGVGAGAALISGQRYGRPAWMAAAGVTVLISGLALGTIYPPIKAIWTLSFDLVAIGFCLLFLFAARLLFDREDETAAQRWIGPALAPIGANAIFAYMFARFFVYPLYPLLAQFPFALELAALMALITGQVIFYRWLYLRGWILRV